LNPDHQKALFNLGWSLMDENRFIEAIPPLKRTISLNPEDTDAHYSLGLVYGKLNHYQEALDQYQLVLQMDPNHSGAYEKLALVQKELEKETVSVKYEEFPKEIDILLIP
jgi:tetratricopeptide (TPR) repeat protein